MNFFRLASLIFITFLAGCITDNQSTSDSTASTNQADKIPAELEWECDSGNGDSCFELATIYRVGETVTPDALRALKFYLLACKADNIDGCIHASENYRNAAENARPDVKTSSELMSIASYYYEKACNLGNAASCYNAGVVHNTGDGEKIDDEKAEEFFQKGCNLFNESSCRALEVKSRKIQSTGNSTKVDRVACNPGQPARCNNLGNDFLNGNGVPKDVPLAIQYYENACEYGEGIGCYNLGAMYENGNGVKRDSVKAVASLRESCRLGYPDGCYLLGEYYNEGKNVGQDDRKAFEFFKTSCDGNVARGCHNLSVSYLKGEVVEKDSARAAQLLQKTCDEGMGRSCGLLGGLYLYGEGVSKDETKAARLEKKACELDPSLC
ncbi:sel1 repeat family protein [Sneathiella marina]|uniref:Sel1 repeat family protein n=1 Tax=Sneathiella marina TaxID=2950108 RepID=A0ABY4WBF5_9PROT|nr:tetratricopeptide repeat protein [Sneathiella marina]USG63257.1 sel1 repeat family protein [Sneathiella marina]